MAALGGTLFSLQKLHDKRHISGKEFHDLTSAYEFLRHLEHRLQLRQGQQTHRLPLSGLELRILRRCMEGLRAGEYRLSDLVATVTRRMAAVRRFIGESFINSRTRRHQEVDEAEFQLRSLIEPGAADQSNQQILERLATDAPAFMRPPAGAISAFRHGRICFAFSVRRLPLRSVTPRGAASGGGEARYYDLSIPATFLPTFWCGIRRRSPRSSSGMKLLPGWVSGNCLRVCLGLRMSFMIPSWNT